MIGESGAAVPVPRTRLDGIVLWGALALSLAAAVVIPHLDRLLNPSAPTPTLLTWIGVPAAVSACATIVLREITGKRLDAGPRFVTLAVAYNTVFLFAKLGLAPWSLYFANQQTAFETTTLGAGPGAYVLIGLVLAALYSLIFLALLQLRRRGVRIRLGLPRPGRLPIVLIVAGAVATLFLLGVGLLIFLFLAYMYAVTVLFTPVGVLLAAALVATVVLADRALSTLGRRALAAADLSLFTTFGFAGVSLIVVYHVVWVVMVGVLISLFPLRVTTSK